MVKREIIWTATAVKQRRQILEYWVFHNSSSQYSKKLVKAINIRTSILAKHSEIGQQTSVKGIREAAMGNFSLYYKILDNQIVIMAFWDNRQDPNTVLTLLRK